MGIAKRLKAPLYIAAVGFVLAAGLLSIRAAISRRPAHAPLLHLSPDRILADGYDAATLRIEGASDEAPRVFIAGPAHVASVAAPERNGNGWDVAIRAGILPGRVTVQAEFSGGPAAGVGLSAELATSDSREDGTPDFLRLDDAGDRRVFQRWFTFLAETQYFRGAALPAEINDCAALIRYAYHEALHAHNGAWAAQANLPLIPALGNVAKYEYPYTALGASLFRVQPGSFNAADTGDGAFAQFADAKALWHFNTTQVSRNLDRAEPGDLLFYRQQHDGRAATYHSMIYLGESQIHPDGARYVVYHTGPQDSGPGEIKRLTLAELRAFPETEWRPDSSNPSFLGVYRWNILSGSGVLYAH